VPNQIRSLDALLEDFWKEVGEDAPATAHAPVAECWVGPYHHAESLARAHEYFTMKPGAPAGADGWLDPTTGQRPVWAFDDVAAGFETAASGWERSVKQLGALRAALTGGELGDATKSLARHADWAMVTNAIAGGLDGKSEPAERFMAGVEEAAGLASKGAVVDLMEGAAEKALEASRVNAEVFRVVSKQRYEEGWQPDTGPGIGEIDNGPQRRNAVVMGAHATGWTLFGTALTVGGYATVNAAQTAATTAAAGGVVTTTTEAALTAAAYYGGAAAVSVGGAALVLGGYCVYRAVYGW
jgi:hypothetical protein